MLQCIISSVELALVVIDSIFLTHYKLDWRTTPILCYLRSCAISSSLELHTYVAIDWDLFIIIQPLFVSITLRFPYMSELALVVMDSIFLTHYKLDWRTTPILCYLRSCAISSSLELHTYVAIDWDLFIIIQPLFVSITLRFPYMSELAIK